MSDRGPGIVAAIAAAYPDLRKSISEKLSEAPRDAELLMLALLVALGGFIAGLPTAFRQAAALGEDGALTGVLVGRLFAAVFVVPLFLLLLAGLAHLIAKIFGGRGSHYKARVALIWALVVALPLGLANGALGPVAIGAFPGPAGQAIAGILSTAATLGFLWIWAQFLCVAEGFTKPVTVFATLLVVPATIATFAAQFIA